jgi:hypothetical protein
MHGYALLERGSVINGLHIAHASVPDSNRGAVRVGCSQAVAAVCFHLITPCRLQTSPKLTCAAGAGV